MEMNWQSHWYLVPTYLLCTGFRYGLTHRGSSACG